MVGKYTKVDLENRNDTPEEKDRLRSIYDDLVLRGKSGITLSAIEQAHVYSGVNFLGENIELFPFIDEARFKQLYLTYFLDLDGGGKYEKVRYGRKIQVPPDERDADLKYLATSAKNWEDFVTPGGFTNQLLQTAAKEAKNDRKELDYSLNITANPLLKGSFFYRAKVRNTYLRSKFLYLMAKEILEETDPADCKMQFCGEEIIFNDFSVIHILNRHFAEITKQFKSGKDYHPEDVKPRILSKQIKEIVEEIDKSKLLTKQDKTEINLRYKGQIYQLWAEWKERYIAGHTGPVRYKQLQSFFPVSSVDVLGKIERDYREVVLSPELSVFVL